MDVKEQANSDSINTIYNKQDLKLYGLMIVGLLGFLAVGVWAFYAITPDLKFDLKKYMSMIKPTFESQEVEDIEVPADTDLGELDAEVKQLEIDIADLDADLRDAFGY